MVYLRKNVSKCISSIIAAQIVIGKLTMMLASHKSPVGALMFCTSHHGDGCMRHKMPNARPLQ